MFILQRTHGNYIGLKMLSMELRSCVCAIRYNRMKIKPQLSPGYNLDKNKEYSLIPLSTFKTFRFVSVISGNTFAMVFGMKKRFQRLKYLILLNHVRLFLSEGTSTKQIFERAHWLFRWELYTQDKKMHIKETQKSITRTHGIVSFSQNPQGLR